MSIFVGQQKREDHMRKNPYLKNPVPTHQDLRKLVLFGPDKDAYRRAMISPNPAGHRKNTRSRYQFVYDAELGHRRMVRTGKPKNLRGIMAGLIASSGLLR